MSLRPVRRIAVLLIALYALGQAGIALAACGMDRGSMAQAMSMPDGSTCGGCPTSEAQPAVGAACVAHCTADLQAANAQIGVAIPAAAARLVIAPPARMQRPPFLAYLPPGGPPRRILLHSFQV